MWIYVRFGLSFDSHSNRSDKKKVLWHSLVRRMFEVHNILFWNSIYTSATCLCFWFVIIVSFSIGFLFGFKIVQLFVSLLKPLLCKRSFNTQIISLFFFCINCIRENCDDFLGHFLSLFHSKSFTSNCVCFAFSTESNGSPDTLHRP